MMGDVVVAVFLLRCVCIYVHVCVYMYRKIYIYMCVCVRGVLFWGVICLIDQLIDFVCLSK